MLYRTLADWAAAKASYDPVDTALVMFEEAHRAFVAAVVAHRSIDPRQAMDGAAAYGDRRVTMLDDRPAHAAASSASRPADETPAGPRGAGASVSNIRSAR